MSTLIITLPTPGASTQDYSYCLATNAQAVGTHGMAALALLPRSDETVLLLPSNAVSWHKVNLPKLSRSISGPKLRALLEGMVEEQVLDDPGQLHIASYRSRGAQDASTWLAVCQKAWLEQHLRSIQSSGRKVSHIFPQAFPLQADPDSDESELHMHISGSADAPLVTGSDDLGVTALPLSQAHHIWPTLDGFSLRLSAEPAVAAAAEAALGNGIKTLHPSEHALQTMLAARNAGLDLAQGDFALKGSGRWLQQASEVLRDLMAAPAWRAARVGLVLLLAAQVIGLNAWAWRERSTLSAKSAMITQQFTQTFPEVKVVIDAPLQMQRELGHLRQASGNLSNHDFESVYARFSSVVQTPQAPSTIDFASNEITLKGVALDATQLGTLGSALQGAQLSVRKDGDSVKVTTLAEGVAP
jgi:general secretion pathway protein L